MIEKTRARILVIKLGALGDFVLATGPFAAIRNAHPDDEITLLTTAPYAEIAEASGYFDEVWVDERPSRINLIAIHKLRLRLRRRMFYRVYDLQTSGRSSWYFHLMKGLARPQSPSSLQEEKPRDPVHPHPDQIADEESRPHPQQRSGVQIASLS